MQHAALLIIDMQQALVTGAFEEQAVLDRIQQLADRMRSKNFPVIYIQHNHSSYEPMMHAQLGWQIHHQIRPYERDIVIEKTASDAFYHTDLESTLRRLEVETLLISGMQTEYCVDATCRSALSHGFDVILLSDCHTTGDSGLTARQIIEHHNTVLANLAHPAKSITPMRSSEVILAS